jgi:hypothetical protein
MHQCIFKLFTNCCNNNVKASSQYKADAISLVLTQQLLREEVEVDVRE